MLILQAMMDFLYYITVDKMDEAFKAIKFIKRFEFTYITVKFISFRHSMIYSN